MKKLLIGAHFGSHDLNISLYDGENFKYIHYERHCSYKNAGLTNLNDAGLFIRACTKAHGYDTQDIKSIACTIGERDDLIVFLKDEKTLVSKINLFENSCESFQLDHHYAHALSSFPVIDTNNH